MVIYGGKQNEKQQIFKRHSDICKSVLRTACTVCHSKHLAVYLHFWVIKGCYCINHTILICLDKLLANIKNDIIFDRVNTEKFKKISICCFYAAVIGIIAGAIFIIIDSVNYIIAVPILILACGEAFMGLITIVIKIVFNRAIEIKNENDLTI